MTDFALTGRRRTLFLDRYGPWAVVTGASSGIGAAIADELAAAGLNLVLVARRRDELEELAAHLGEQHRAETRVVPADLGRDDDALLAATDDLDVGLLVAAAGFGTSGDFRDAELSTELDMLAVNCGAVLRLSLHFSRRMVQRGRGGIVLFGSVVGFQGTPRAAHYAATKAWVQTLGEGLHHELRPYGVDVLVSAPGPVNSGFADRAGMKMGAALTPPQVAGPTLRALGRRSTVTPGGLSKLLTWSLAVLPRRLRTRIMATVMRGMTLAGPRARKP